MNVIVISNFIHSLAYEAKRYLDTRFSGTREIGNDFDCKRFSSLGSFIYPLFFTFFENVFPELKSTILAKYQPVELTGHSNVNVTQNKYTFSWTDCDKDTV